MSGLQGVNGTMTATEGDFLKRIETLATSRRTYKDIIVFDTPQEAIVAGYHMLYRDELAGITIYGKPIDKNYPKVCLPAAVLDSVEENN